MKIRCFRILLSAALVTVFSGTASHAATRARFGAETILNDSSVRISAGTRHTCQVKEDGAVRCWGANDQGQLGNGSTTGGRTPVPVLVSGVVNAVAVVAGDAQTCALLAGGTVRCWGDNRFGQLGDGSTVDRLTPVAVSGVVNAVAIAAGAFHTCALLADGTARCWGNNGSGELGDGTTTDKLTPVPVSGLATAVAISAGFYHTCALLANGAVRCWGNNDFGELGIRSFGGKQLTPVVVTGLSNAVALAADAVHTCALLADGTARCWGSNNTNGALGDGTTVDRSSPVTVSGLTNAVAIAAGVSHTCALLADGSAKCWGHNNEGQIGDGSIGVSRLTPVPVAPPFNVLTNAVAITAGSAHTCALLADGSAKCWGNNESGQLGNGTFPRSIGPAAVVGGGGSFTARDVAAGRNHTCAVRANGTVACWGSNDSAQIGDGTIGVNRLSPVAVVGLSNVVAIAAGDAHTCALLANGTARCWGANGSGQIGDTTFGGNRLTPLPVFGLTNAIAIAAGDAHTCALLANGTAHCWGANGSGQLGDGTFTFRSRPGSVSGVSNAVSIAAGEFHSCAMVAVGVPFCWGFNGSGQLGDGGLAGQNVPRLVSLDNTVAIAGGNTHSCALRADGTAWCWGGNLLGELGINSTASRTLPTLVVNLSDVVAIAGGFGHSCALVAGGGARCWGDNGSGQLGDGSTTQRLTPAIVTKATSTLVFGGGSTVSGVITFPISNTVQIATGRRHSCALFATGGLSCWGDNAFGQLGISSTINQLRPVGAPSFTVNIDPIVTLESNSRVTRVTVLAACEAGQQLHLEVTLTQGAVTGRGAGAGKCTGVLERYPVTTPAHGHNPFADGPAQVSAAALMRDGAVGETHAWTRQVNIVREP
jgi:alpha-tubulin suppressor-like RCC1 family protein